MNVIEATDLVKRYGDRTAVNGVSFTVEEGEIFAILGPNGAGKTTTVESIGGLRTPDSGTINVLGLDPSRDRDELRRVVGIQLQESELPDQIRVAEAMDLYTARQSRSPAPETSSWPSRRSSPATTSWPTTCGSSRPIWTTPSSPSRGTLDTAVGRWLGYSRGVYWQGAASGLPGPPDACERPTR